MVLASPSPRSLDTLQGGRSKQRALDNCASSGEATLLAFLGRPNVRTFGDSTAGYNSVNNGFRLSDGAHLVITVGYSRDRLGRAHALSVAPDEIVHQAADTAVDAPLDRARSWLLSEPTCTGRGRGGRRTVE